MLNLILTIVLVVLILAVVFILIVMTTMQMRLEKDIKLVRKLVDIIKDITWNMEPMMGRDLRELFKSANIEIFTTLNNVEMRHNVVDRNKNEKA